MAEIERPKTHSAGKGSVYHVLRTQTAAQACQQQCRAGQPSDQGHRDRASPSPQGAMLGRWLADAGSWGLYPLPTRSHNLVFKSTNWSSVLEETPLLRGRKRNPEPSQQWLQTCTCHCHYSYPTLRPSPHTPVFPSPRWPGGQGSGSLLQLTGSFTR